MLFDSGSVLSDEEEIKIFKIKSPVDYKIISDLIEKI